MFMLCLFVCWLVLVVACLLCLIWCVALIVVCFVGFVWLFVVEVRQLFTNMKQLGYSTMLRL